MHIAPRHLNGASRAGRHVLDLERLKDKQQRLAVDQLTADLAGKVLAHIRPVELAPGGFGVGLALVLRAFDAPGCLALDVLAGDSLDLGLQEVE